ncbi:lysophospholipid acyltransferase family protein [Paucilactobacillus wasatchensis]|uniref:1-acyl-sn-glycerol-3-phosphate acyltransferase n=1 Tax=Paucilactobacillus wasatchensis TaxID=1335616 RepID=A0A0D1A6Z4_9LACO|nr:1-acyl-sn-glycerol-3-phosphate acyltransferase [Paucilactobacillus wasatchensis]KIS03620.1 1-acyl-sn-glycerol-3-phosphate acyltransferase [Paucilactobacillus wasatchensis]
MFYSFLRVIVRILIYVINGKPKYLNKNNLPQGNYILVGPHRTWFEPVYYALAASPKKFSFMAKEELFKNPIIRFILNHANAYPVNRTNPGPSAIKKPVRLLKQSELATIIFPTGSRYSAEMKGGALVIAKLASVPLVPTVYQGPLTFKSLFKRGKATVAFGKPIEIDRHKKLTDDYQHELEQRMQTEFERLDKQIDPNFHYEMPKKPADDQF